jgi:hypothetical protein
MNPFEIGARVRCQRLFWHWKQTPGTVREFDRLLGVVLVEFDGRRKQKWLHTSILEPAR